MSTHDERLRRENRLFFWLGSLVLLLAAAIYVVWRWLRPGAEAAVPEPATQVPQEVDETDEAQPVQEPGQQLERDEQGLSAWLIMLVSTLLMAVLAFGLLLLFGSLPTTITEALPDLAYFEGEVFGAFASDPVPIPVLQEASPVDRQALTDLQRERLDSYGWVSEEEKIVHIPLERAALLVVTRGLPTPVPTATPAPPTATATEPAATAAAVTPSPTAAGPTPTVNPTAAVAGEQLFTSLGCNTCHPGGGAGTGPSLIGLLGRQVELQSGETITADPAYIRSSILQPDQHIVAGYSNVMPNFEGQVSDRELSQLVAYIRSLND